MLRPMANLFALASREDRSLDRVEASLTACGEFDAVWRPAPGWLAAVAPLPESESDGEALHSRGFAFVEGRDRVERPDTRWLDRVAELADRMPHRLAELPGDFSFVRFRRDGSALAVRSCAGPAPIYLHRRAGGGLAVASLLQYFTRFLPDRFVADPLVNACWDTRVTFMDGRTFLAGVSILPRASHTELAVDRPPRTGIYWDPRPAAGSAPEASPDHARELRRVLVATLERDLDPAGRNLITLSGGVDSSSVAALAVGATGRKMSSWSLIPQREPARTHERSYIDPIISRFGLEPSHILDDTAAARSRWLADAPCLPFQVVHPALCDLPRVSAEQEVRVLVGAEFADDVCGSVVRLGDWARHSSLKATVARRDLLPFGSSRYYGVWLKRRALAALGRPLLPDLAGVHPAAWVHPMIVAEYEEWARRFRARHRADRRPLRDLAVQLENDAWIVMSWEAASPLGIRRSAPFFSREALELAFRCHPHDLLGRRGTKRLLRDALGSDVPVRNLHRSDKGLWLTAEEQRVRLDDPVPAAASGLVRPDWLPVPPPDQDLSTLRAAIRVVEYLDGRGRRGGTLT